MVARIRENLEPMQKLLGVVDLGQTLRHYAAADSGGGGLGVQAAGVWRRKPVEPAGVRSPLGRPVRVKPAARVVGVLAEAGHSG